MYFTTFGWELYADPLLGSQLTCPASSTRRSPTRSSPCVVRLRPPADLGSFTRLVAVIRRSRSLEPATSRPSCASRSRHFLTSQLGLLNFVTRPLGGYVADRLYAAGYGVKSKKYLTITLGFLMGCMSLAMGLVIDRARRTAFLTPADAAGHERERYLDAGARLAHRARSARRDLLRDGQRHELQYGSSLVRSDAARRR